MRTFLTILLCTLFYSGFSFGTDWNVYVSKYRHDKVCAISYTFDDGLASTIHWQLRNWNNGVFAELFLLMVLK